MTFSSFYFSELVLLFDLFDICPINLTSNDGGEKNKNLGTHHLIPHMRKPLSFYHAVFHLTYNKIGMILLGEIMILVLLQRKYL